jgi:maleylpyruvate isomerase
MAGAGRRPRRNLVDSDPGRLRARIDAATGRLTAAAAGLTDAQVRELSRLPGWSRGHVLAHLARNADGLRNLLIWARTGVRTPQYPSQEAREAGIAAGAGRAAAALAEDLEQSAAAFAAEAAIVPDGAWDVLVRGMNGPEHPAWFTLFRRLTEVESITSISAAGTGRRTGRRRSSPTSWSGCAGSSPAVTTSRPA